MFSRPNSARLFAFAVFSVIVGGGLFVFVSQASTNVEPAPAAAQPGIASNQIPYESWGGDLSPDAVDADGIEKDLDGNASALFPSDWLRAPGVR